MGEEQDKKNTFARLRRLQDPAHSPNPKTRARTELGDSSRTISGGAEEMPVRALLKKRNKLTVYGLHLLVGLRMSKDDGIVTEG